MVEVLSVLMRYLVFVLIGFTFLLILLNSIRKIGPTEIGLVVKRWGFKKLQNDNPVAFEGEAGYQEKLLMPGYRWAFWPLFAVRKFPWVQVPAGEIGIVFSQIGKPLPIGAKSGVYKSEFGNYNNPKVFIENDGEKGLQRIVLPPGTLAPIHPVAFLVATSKGINGLALTSDFEEQVSHMSSEKFKQIVVEPNGSTDVVGVVFVHEGPPSENGAMASRIGDFVDIQTVEREGKTNCERCDSKIVEMLQSSKNYMHNSYQDFQAFLDNGGKIGLQHDTLPYGTYSLNPFLVTVELAPMLVVGQGEVAVIKSYIGLPTEDTSGEEFKFGTLVVAGHRGIWREPLRTGKYGLNPRIYGSEKVPTYILNLSWAEATSKAHDLDNSLSQINARSNEGFQFKIDLQVQIHVPDVMAPKVISSVGTMKNLVMEVLHPAVGNYFRDKVQSMPAVKFIQNRIDVQSEAQDHIVEHLRKYNVEVKGVYIQDVALPDEITTVLKEREIANQEKATFEMQRASQEARILMENSKGKADQQAMLVQSAVGVEISKNKSEARKLEGEGEAAYISQIGEANAVEVRSVGMAKAEAYEKQVAVLGQEGTTRVNVVELLAKHNIAIVPKIQGGSGDSGLGSAVLGYLAPKLDELKEDQPNTNTKQK